MRKLLNRRDLFVIGLLLLLSAGIMLSCMFRGNVYGSEEDWGSQHYAIPEYFRMLFYNTHTLFPSYAANIGGGENIYALSYYGLYSPVILLSYLFPFIPMGLYIMGAGIATALISELLFYAFLRKRFCTRTAGFTALFFTFSLPLLLHSHRHIMFLTFMPFLLMSMHLTDRYFRRGTKSPLVICTALMILCNYFFACSALCALSAYGLYAVMEGERKRLSEIVRRWVPFWLLLMTAVLIAGVLLLPTAGTLLSGRDKANAAVSFRDFLPTLRYDWLTYFGYTMGTSAFGIFAALYYLINGRQGKRFLAALIMLFAVCPFLTYLLNGMLYFDSKVLFAFLPLALLLTAFLADKLFSGDFSRLALPCILLAVTSAASAFLCGFSIPMYAYAADTAGTVLIISLIAVRKSLVRLAYGCLAVPMVVCIAGNHIDKMQKSQVYHLVNSPTVQALTKEVSAGKMVRTAIDTNRLNTVNKVYGITHYQDTIYSSVHSRDYNRFFFEEICNENQFRNSALTTRSRNVLFNTFMGNRYYISTEPVSFFGYEQIKETPDGFRLYENANAFPMLYASDRLMSRRQYETLDYPDKTEALMRFRIVDTDMPDTEFVPSAQPADIGDPFEITPFLREDERPLAEIANGVRRFTLNDSLRTYQFPLPEKVRGQILMLRVCVNNPKDPGDRLQRGWERMGDVRIKINGVKNTLTDPDWKYYNHNRYFEFVLADNSDHLDIELTGRHFELSQLSVYTLDPAILEESASVLTPFEPDLQKTGGDVIEGSITTDTDGWFASSLVWHEGFSVTVDEKPVTPQKTNLAFLGFPLPAGRHHIRITYRAPLLNAGLAVSGTGCLILLILAVLDLRKCRKS